VKYQLLPSLTDAEMVDLTADIKERGVMVPVEIDEHGAILDGHHRVMIADSLGIDYPTVVRSGWTEAQKVIHVVALNAHRRHLTSAQKHDLNALIRTMVVEVVEDPKTGEEMRIGLSRPERASKLGVTVPTIVRWDEEGGLISNDIDPDGPTHIRRSGGNTSPYPMKPAKPGPKPRSRDRDRPVPLRKDRPVPAWSRHFSLFCRRSRPEDREFLLRMAREIHAALRQNDIEYEED
jgi:hypothetical protein